MNGVGYDDLLNRLDRWTNIQAAQVILSSLTPDVRKAVMTEVKLGGGGLGCLRALYRPHLTDEAADLQIAKDRGINLLFASISDAANSSRRSQQYKHSDC